MMNVDPQDVMVGAFGRIAQQAMLFFAAVWIGSMAGGFALACGLGVGSFTEALKFLPKVLMGPGLLLNSWIALNSVVLLGGAAYFILSEDAGFKAWGILAGVESLFVMLGYTFWLKGIFQISVAWSVWFALLVMMETGVWLIRQMLVDRWAHELATVQMQNAQRRAQNEIEERQRISLEKEW
jgi:hypothetical protein